MQFHWQHEFLFHPTHPGISLHGSAGNTLLYPTDRTSGASQGCSQNFFGDSSLGAMESTNLPSRLLGSWTHVCFSGKMFSAGPTDRQKTHACSVRLCTTCTVPQLPPEGTTWVWMSILVGPLVGERDSSYRGSESTEWTPREMSIPLPR